MDSRNPLLFYAYSR